MSSERRLRARALRVDAALARRFRCSSAAARAPLYTAAALATTTDSELVETPPRRARILQAVRRQGLLPSLDALGRWGGGLAASYVRRPRGSFTYRGRSYDVHVSRNGRTWMTERGVEIPIFLAEVRAAAGRRVLEVGRVLQTYVDGLDHTVVDKYEQAPGVLNVDVMDYRPEEPFDLIVAISTLEHVGWEEAPRDAEKALQAVEHLRSLLAPGGSLYFDFPVGAHPLLDRAAFDGTLTVEGCMRRVGRSNRWVEATVEEVRDIPYDTMIWRGNAIVLCRLQATA